MNTNMNTEAMIEWLCDPISICGMCKEFSEMPEPLEPDVIRHTLREVMDELVVIAADRAETASDVDRQWLHDVGDLDEVDWVFVQDSFEQALANTLEILLPVWFRIRLGRPGALGHP
jgi:hypothetical protein